MAGRSVFLLNLQCVKDFGDPHYNRCTDLKHPVIPKEQNLTIMKL